MSLKLLTTFSFLYFLHTSALQAMDEDESEKKTISLTPVFVKSEDKWINTQYYPQIFSCRFLYGETKRTWRSLSIGKWHLLYTILLFRYAVGAV